MSMLTAFFGTATVALVVIAIQVGRLARAAEAFVSFLQWMSHNQTEKGNAADNPET